MFASSTNILLLHSNTPYLTTPSTACTVGSGFSSSSSEYYHQYLQYMLLDNTIGIMSNVAACICRARPRVKRISFSHQQQYSQCKEVEKVGNPLQRQSGARLEFRGWPGMEGCTALHSLNFNTCTSAPRAVCGGRHGPKSIGNNAICWLSVLTSIVLIVMVIIIIMRRGATDEESRVVF